MKHRWDAPVRTDANNTYRKCSRCPIVKITRHEPENFPQAHWIEFEYDGAKLPGRVTPKCEAAA